MSGNRKNPAGNDRDEKSNPQAAAGEWWIHEMRRDEKAMRKNVRKYGPVTVTVCFRDGTEGTCECDRCRDCDIDAYGYYDHVCIDDCAGCLCSNCDKISTWKKKETKSS